MKHKIISDCGGIRGYEELLAYFANPDDPMYEDKREWAEFHSCDNFEPEKFNKKDVRFNDVDVMDHMFFL